MVGEEGGGQFDFEKAVGDAWKKPEILRPEAQPFQPPEEPDFGEPDELFKPPEELEPMSSVIAPFNEQLEKIGAEQAQTVADEEGAKKDKKHLKKDVKALKTELNKKKKKAAKEVEEKGEPIRFDEEDSIEEKLSALEELTAGLAEAKLTKKRQKELVKAIRKDKRRAIFRGVQRWFTSTTTIEKHAELSKEEKAARRRKILGAVFTLAGICACLTTWVVAPIVFQGYHPGDLAKDKGDQALGAGEPHHNDYVGAAEAAWARYTNDGPTPGGMFDPMAIDDTDTKLLTGYFPGWFCVPQQVQVCEDMLGIRLDVPKGEAAQESFFFQMRENWDEEMWPIMKANPNLPPEVKDFYDPANRDDLRNWYRQEFPINSGTWLNKQKTVADEKFAHFLVSGQLVPRDVKDLGYSHLLGSFVATGYMGIKIPMLLDGFMAAGEILPQRVHQAIRVMEEITGRDDYIFSDIEPYQQIIDSYYAATEKALVKKGQLKLGALGRV